MAVASEVSEVGHRSSLGRQQFAQPATELAYLDALACVDAISARKAALAQRLSELALDERWWPTRSRGCAAFTALRLRMERDLTQQALARLLGTSVPTISRLESGQHRPNVETLQKLARVRWYRERFKFHRGHWSYLQGCLSLPTIKINLVWEPPDNL